MAGALPNREPAVGMAEALRQRKRALLGLAENINLKGTRDDWARGMPGREPWDIQGGSRPLASGQDNQAAETYRALQEPTPNLDVIGINAAPGQTAPVVQAGLVVEPALVDAVTKASPDAKKRAGAAMEQKGVDVEAIWKAAYDKAPTEDGFNLRATIEGYREKYKPKEGTDFTKEEKSMLLLELGMRMMSAAGQPGASTGGAIGQAGMGTLGTMRGMQKDKKAALIDAEDRGERRALGEANIDLQQRALGEKAEDRRIGAANSAVDRALAGEKSQRDAEQAQRDAQGAPTYMTDKGGVLNRVFRSGPAEGVLDAEGQPFVGQKLGGGRKTLGEIRQAAWLVEHSGDTAGALDALMGNRPLGDSEAIRLATSVVNSTLQQAVRQPSLEEKNAMIQRQAQLFKDQYLEESGASAQPQGSPLAGQPTPSATAGNPQREKYRADLKRLNPGKSDAEIEARVAAKFGG